jgi:hypothetical protein
VDEALTKEEPTQMDYERGCIACGKPTLGPGAQCCQKCEEKQILTTTAGGILGLIVLAALGPLFNLGAGIGVALGLAGAIAGALIARAVFRKAARARRAQMEQ